MSIVSNAEHNLKNKKEIIEILSTIKQKCLEEKIKTLLTIYSEKRICELLNNFASKETEHFKEEIIQEENFFK